ncbi:MAG: Holliday junction resolvase RuvX [Gammaproteobacteria bacterium]|nr:Holliday junction resolvase RuvX [Gammaproteobacteria bacterium]
MSQGTPRQGFRIPEVVLAFDFGMRRIGIAVGDTLTRTARPLAALSRKSPALSEIEWRSLEAQAIKTGARQLVVGCPYNADRSPSVMTERATAFAKTLGSRLKLPVHMVDERYSSLEAEATLRGRRTAGERKRYDRAAIDSAAATVILERWLGGE